MGTCRSKRTIGSLPNSLSRSVHLLQKGDKPLPRADPERNRGAQRKRRVRSNLRGDPRGRWTTPPPGFPPSCLESAQPDPRQWDPVEAGKIEAEGSETCQAPSNKSLRALACVQEWPGTRQPRRALRVLPKGAIPRGVLWGHLS